jgi:hypothetical protein
MIARNLLLAGLALLLVAPATAEQASKSKERPATDRKSDGPKSLGQFEDWIAATHQEAGQTVCYAFTRAHSSTPQLKGRGGVVLTVTQRPTRRDDVAIEAGFSFAQGAFVTVQADQAGLDFYTSQRAAFARNGHAAVQAFQKAGRAVASSPGPHEVKVTDTFSLKGFSSAYVAISKACPAR